MTNRKRKCHSCNKPLGATVHKCHECGGVDISEYYGEVAASTENTIGDDVTYRAGGRTQR